MPIDLSKRVDPDDLADDDVKALSDKEVRDALYQVTERIKEVLFYQESVIEQLVSEVKRLEALIPP